METKKCDVGVVIGRFQVDKLHAGHLELLLWVCQHHKKVIVLLGVPPVFTRENPLDYQSRAAMINALGLPILVAPLADCRSNSDWSQSVDSTLKTLLSPGQTAILYGSRDSFINLYNGSFPTEELVGSQQFWSGTATRNEIRQCVRDSEDFRAGVIWGATNRYPAVHPTVDAIIRCEDKYLIVQKPNEDKFRFVGGFADPYSYSYEEDMSREIQEEVNLEVRSTQYLFSLTINDWRYSGVDKIKSLVFLCDVDKESVTLGDDLVGGKYKWVEEFVLDDFVNTHKPIVERYLKCV